MIVDDEGHVGMYLLNNDIDKLENVQDMIRRGIDNENVEEIKVASKQVAKIDRQVSETLQKIVDQETHEINKEINSILEDA